MCLFSVSLQLLALLGLQVIALQMLGLTGFVNDKRQMYFRGLEMVGWRIQNGHLQQKSEKERRLLNRFFSGIWFTFCSYIGAFFNRLNLVTAEQLIYCLVKMVRHSQISYDSQNSQQEVSSSVSSRGRGSRYLCLSQYSVWLHLKIKCYYTKAKAIQNDLTKTLRCETRHNLISDLQHMWRQHSTQQIKQ